MKKYYVIIIAGIILCFSNQLFAQKQSLGHPTHIFFEFGPLSQVPDASVTKNGSHFSAGMKKHTWIENRPVQIEFDLNYRRVTFYDSLEVKNNCGMGEFYLGPRLQISKTSPLYPTASVLGGGYWDFGSVGGLSALITAGIYYNFTGAGTARNGITIEATYHTAKININGYTIPPAFALRIGFYF
jgi:hypothetical protein